MGSKEKSRPEVRNRYVIVQKKKKKVLILAFNRKIFKNIQIKLLNYNIQLRDSEVLSVYKDM